MITDAQTQAALDAIRSQFGVEADDDNGPILVADYWGSPAIVWEGGLYDWVHLARWGGISEEYAEEMRELGRGPLRIGPAQDWPAGVDHEVLDIVAIALYEG
jgi:hypothetical protein